MNFARSINQPKTKTEGRKPAITENWGNRLMTAWQQY